MQDFSRWDVAPLKPDSKGNWLSTAHPEWESYLPLADPSIGPNDTQGAKVEAIFRVFSNGVKTQRDEWVWAADRRSLANKVKFLIAAYESDRHAFQEAKHQHLDKDWTPTSKIKWDRELDHYVRRNIQKAYDTSRVWRASHRPFVESWLYFDSHLNAMTYRLPSLYRPGLPNPTIAFRGIASENLLAVLATDRVFDLGYLKTGNGGTGGVTRYRYLPSGERLDNITDWALKRFREHYSSSPLVGEDRGGGRAASAAQVSHSAADAAGPHSNPSPRGGGAAISKDDIFAYCYAALHDPVYRETFAADLRREFPRIPLHEDFAQWRDWGEALLKQHIGYEKAKPFKFGRVDRPSPLRGRGTAAAQQRLGEGQSGISTAGVQPGSSPPLPAHAARESPSPAEGGGIAKPILRSRPDEGIVVVDTETQLTGIPREAWDYRLGNRSAIDWVLDQHKEKTPRDPTVREKFNSYRFADHKESMIELLARVITISLETVKITEAMRAVERGE